MEIDGLAHSVTPIPQNAMAMVIEQFKPDAVVGNSLVRWSWRMVLEQCRSHAIPAILYIREEESLPHLDGEDRPDAIVANAESLAPAVRERRSVCEFIPSVVDVGITRTTSTRRVALAINPIESRGVDIVWRVATRLPEIQFVLQESWPLTPEQLALVEQKTAQLENVELRRVSAPGPELYGDAKVVLVPYRVDNRPRVIAEAQANGIPVVAGDVAALVEAIGEGGVTVPLGDVDGWVLELKRIWQDETYYEGLCRAAEQHSHRPEIDPAAVAQRFLAVVETVVSGRVR